MIGSPRWPTTHDRRTRAGSERARTDPRLGVEPPSVETPNARGVGNRARGGERRSACRAPSIHPSGRRCAGIAATAASPVSDGERVLFMSWRGWSTHLAIETVLAHAVLRRGGAPVFAYCGGRLPICDVMPVDAAPPMPCHSCREYAAGAINAAGFDSVALHDVIDVGTSVRIARKRVAGLATVAECEAYVDRDSRSDASFACPWPGSSLAARSPTSQRSSPPIDPSW